MFDELFSVAFALSTTLAEAGLELVVIAAASLLGLLAEGAEAFVRSSERRL